MPSVACTPSNRCLLWITNVRDADNADIRYLRQTTEKHCIRQVVDEYAFQLNLTFIYQKFKKRTKINNIWPAELSHALDDRPD